MVAYDLYCGAKDPDDPESTTASDVAHGYAIHLNPDAERDEWQISYGDISDTTPGAFPITLVRR